jgi:hypothetical protein
LGVHHLLANIFFGNCDVSLLDDFDAEKYSVVTNFMLQIASGSQDMYNC